MVARDRDERHEQTFGVQRRDHLLDAEFTGTQPPDRLDHALGR
ncbi:hypothetical protein [Homoserinibacter gongjuensis]